MGISRSPEESHWIGGALVYSGRRDPAWPVPPEVGDRLARLWDRLPPWSGVLPLPPPLGYRGCRLIAPDGRAWTAFRDLVTLEADGRRDGERDFERSLVASAPADIQTAVRALLT
jgi:hypothetical protein